MPHTYWTDPLFCNVDFDHSCEGVGFYFLQHSIKLQISDVSTRDILVEPKEKVVIAMGGSFTRLVEACA